MLKSIFTLAILVLGFSAAAEPIYFNCTAVVGGYEGIPDDIGTLILNEDDETANLLGLQFLNYNDNAGRTRIYSNGMGFVLQFPAVMFNRKPGQITVIRYEGNPRESENDLNVPPAGEKSFRCKAN